MAEHDRAVKILEKAWPADGVSLGGRRVASRIEGGQIGREMYALVIARRLAEAGFAIVPREPSVVLAMAEPLNEEEAAIIWYAMLAAASSPGVEV